MYDDDDDIDDDDDVVVHDVVVVIVCYSILSIYLSRVYCIQTFIHTVEQFVCCEGMMMLLDLLKKFKHDFIIIIVRARKVTVINFAHKCFGRSDL